MAVSQTQKNELYQFFTAAFDAAAGAVYINQLYDAAASGMTTKQIVNVFTTKPQFQALYPQGMSDAAFAASWIETLVGNSASANAKASAAAEITAGLNAGMSRGDVIYAAFTNLNAKPFTDPVWGETSKMFQNQLVVSKYYTEVMLGQETAVPYLQNVLSQVTPSSDVSSPAAILAVIGAAPGLANITLTPNQDAGGIFNGSIFSDTFLATQSTLQLGDQLNGGNGTDTLSLTIGGSGGLLTGFSTDSIEVIKVKALTSGANTLDLSDVKGATTLFSYETDGAQLTFHDIQSINDTQIKVVDTDEVHVFQYDVGNSATDTDVARIAVQEMRYGSAVVLENNNTPGESFVDQIDLNSAVRADAGVQPSNTYKNDMALVAGEDLDTLNITGDADLWLTNVLDENISRVDAHTHTGAQGVNQEVQNIIGNWWELELDMSNSNDGVDFADDGNVPTVTLLGSQGDNYIEFGSTNNDKDVTLYGGNDWLRTGTGEAKVDLGAGNDTLTAGALNDSVNAGSGNDLITDAGSNYEGWKNGDSVSGVYYIPDYVAGGNYYDLGAGNDSLTVSPVGGQSTSAPQGVELRPMYGQSLNTVIGGAGNDVVVIHGSAYAANSRIGLTGYNSVDLGADNDLVTIGDAVDGHYSSDTGNNSVVGGAGNDSIAIWQDGNQTIDAGEGNDSVQVGGRYDDYTNGNHNIELGGGDDKLTVWGSSRTQDGVTTINAGAGNDYIYVQQDHVLSSNLGAGADTLQIRAEDLSSDDTIVGGNTDGFDTIKLSNASGALETGLVRQSETAHTSQIENFFLQDSGIRLDLTDHLFQTAQDNSITVDTTESTPTPELPNGLVQQYFNGMTYDQYVANGSWSGNSQVNVQITGLLPHAGTDPVYFLYTGPSVTQTVDMTAVTTPDFHFTLVGGTQRDIVIGNDATINGQSTLAFDGAPVNTDAWNSQDTLVVVDGADITTADLRNVTQLERIELTATSNASQDWHIELNTRVINQTTGTENLTIVVDSDVAAGSNLYITHGQDGWAGADTNVIVLRNANVNVFIDGVIVNSADYNTGANVVTFNVAGKGLQVYTDYLFTTSSDNLVGTNNAKGDVFVANSIDEVQSSDQVDGKGGGADTVLLNFAVADSRDDLTDQLNNPYLKNIEILQFNTVNEVQMKGFQNPASNFTGDAPFANDLTTLITGSGNDTLTNINRDDLSFSLGIGNDFISFDNVVHKDSHLHSGNSGTVNPDGSKTLVSFYATVDGGAGNDTVGGTSVADNLHLSSVMSVSSGAGDDNITFDENSGPTTVNGGYGYDRVQLDQNGTAGVITINDAESISGGSGSDTIQAYIDSYSQYPGGGWFYETIYGYGGADSIAVDADGSGYVLVDGGAGNDTIDIQDNGTVGTVYVTAVGGVGEDHITVGAYSPDYITVYGDEWGGTGGNGSGWGASVAAGGDADTIKVHADVYFEVYGQGGADSIVVDSDGSGWVDGGSGNDTITATADNGLSVLGGSGDDSIIASANADGDTVTVGTGYIDGGSGNDYIQVGSNSTVAGHPAYDNGPNFITGGAGDDHIVLQKLASGTDTIVFGNIDYGPLQSQVANTQGYDVVDNFNFELAGGDSVHPASEDVLNFDSFLNYGGWNFNYTMDTAAIGSNNNNAIKFANWTSGVTVVDVDNGIIPLISDPATPTNDPVDAKVVVLNVNNSFGINDLKNALVLDTNAIESSSGAGLHLDDGSRTVVILAKDSVENPLVGYDTFEVYFVQDVDSSSASAVWAVDLVATINSTTAIGSTAGSIQVGNNIVW